VRLSQHFQVAAGMTAGRYHRTPGSLGNSQDAYRLHITDDLIVAVSSDGCGSSPFSQFGARLTVNLLCKIIPEIYTPETVFDQKWFDQLLTALTTDLKDVALNYLDGDPNTAAQENLMATAGGIIMTPDVTCVFGAGDFFFGTDGQDGTIEWKPDKGGYPRYPLYSNARFRLKLYRTADIRQLFFGTDGVGALLETCNDPDSMIPGTDDYVGPFGQIWTNDAFYVEPESNTEPTALDVWLNNLATSVRMPGPPHHTGLLDDDTTLVAIRRIQQVHKEPEAT